MATDSNDLKPYNEICEQGDWQTWAENRVRGIGASEIAAVLGENPWKSRIRVWAEKTGRLPREDLSDREHVQMGIELEPFVARKYQERSGRAIQRAAWLLQSKDHPWALCTPDYWIQDEGGVFRIPLQIKTTSEWRAKDWQDGPPAMVYLQVHHEMLVTGAPWASVGVLVGGQRFYWADVPRDEATITRIAREGLHFWRLCEDDEPPEPDDSADAGEVVDLLYPVPDSDKVALPPVALDWDRRLQTLKAEKKLVDQQIKELETQLRLAIGGAEVGVLPDGSGAYTWRLQHRDQYTVKEADFRVLRRVNKIPATGHSS